MLREGSPSSAGCSLDSEPAEERTQGSEILWRVAPPPHSTRAAPLTGPLAFPRPGELMNTGSPPSPPSQWRGEAVAGRSPRAVGVPACRNWTVSQVVLERGLGWFDSWKGAPCEKLRVSYRGLSCSLASLRAPTLSPN